MSTKIAWIDHRSARLPGRALGNDPYGNGRYGCLPERSWMSCFGAALATTVTLSALELTSAAAIIATIRMVE
jgi:hypothetical protein